MLGKEWINFLKTAMVLAVVCVLFYILQGNYVTEREYRMSGMAPKPRAMVQLEEVFNARR